MCGVYRILSVIFSHKVLYTSCMHGQTTIRNTQNTIKHHHRSCDPWSVLLCNMLLSMCIRYVHDELSYTRKTELINIFIINYNYQLVQFYASDTTLHYFSNMYINIYTYHHYLHTYIYTAASLEPTSLHRGFGQSAVRPQLQKCCTCLLKTKPC